MPLLTCSWKDRCDDESGETMEFRLTYEGPLKSNGSPKDKHIIRKHFHKQLQQLWDKAPELRSFKTQEAHYGLRAEPSVLEQLRKNKTTEFEFIASQFERYGFRFLPLVSKSLSLVCGLHIVFLRRSIAGDLILRGGDIDNRIKTLLDALRTPDTSVEVAGHKPEADEDPFYCLLQDDSLITELSVITDRLLSPLRDGQHEDEVVLMIHVRLKTVVQTIANMGLG